MRRSLVAAVAAALLGIALLATGCAGSKAPAGSVPESASLAPADAIAYVTLTTDEGSAQWTKADQLLRLFPGARSSLLDAVRSALAGEGLEWDRDVAPALGPEVVVVATSEGKPVVLTKPDDGARLTALLATLDQPTVTAEVSGWTAIGQQQAELDAYRSALESGTLAGDDAFADAMADQPAEALVRMWVNGTALQDMIPGALLGATGQPPATDGSTGSGATVDGLDLGLESLALAVAAEDDGLLLAVSATTSRATDGTRYTPKLVASVPGDAVAALSFGGSQRTFDSLRGPLDALSEGLDSVAGVSLEGLFDALSGEGVVYVRRGEGQIPEVTLVLAPPDAAKAFGTIDTAIRKLAADQNAAVRTTTVDGVSVTEVAADGATISYAQPDGDTVIVTTGPNGIAEFRGSGEKLVTTAGYLRAAETVGLGELTKGFLYADLDGLIPLVDGIAGPETLPPDAREVLGRLDSFILQSDGDGTSTRVSGFVRVNR